MGFTTPRLTIGEASADVSRREAFIAAIDIRHRISVVLPFDRHVNQVFDAAVVKDFFLC